MNEMFGFKKTPRHIAKRPFETHSAAVKSLHEPVTGIRAKTNSGLHSQRAFR